MKQSEVLDGWKEVADLMDGGKLFQSKGGFVFESTFTNLFSWDRRKAVDVNVWLVGD